MVLIKFGGQKGVAHNKLYWAKRRGFNDTESNTEKLQVLSSMESLLLLHSIRRVFPRLVVEKETVNSTLSLSPNVREWD